jgi:excisionase family DNA binding protein
MNSPEQDMHQDSSLVRAGEVAALLSVSVQRVYELARRGIIPSVHLGKTLRFSPEGIKTFIATGGCASPGRQQSVEQATRLGQPSGFGS